MDGRVAWVYGTQYAVALPHTNGHRRRLHHAQPICRISTADSVFTAVPLGQGVPFFCCRWQKY